MAIKAVIATQFDATGLKKATSAFNKLGGTLSGALGAVGLGVGLAAITAGLKESAKAAVSDVKSQALLAQQLKNTVGATDTAIASTEDFISKLMLQTSVADDQLRPALASLVRATGSVSSAQSLLALSTDIAAGTGKDLSAVSIAVGKAAAGQTTALFKLVPSLKGSADWAKQAGIEFGGMAAAAANTDPFQRINIIMGEMQETIGMALLPTLNEFANWFASPEGQAKVQEFVDVIIAGVTGLTQFANWISENIDWLSQLAIGIAATTVAVGIFNLALNVNPIMLAVTAIGLLVTAMLALNKAAGISASGVPTAVNAAAVKAGQTAYEKAMRDKSNFEQTSTGPKLKTGAAMVAEKARVAAYEKAIADYKKSITQVDKGLQKSQAVSPTLSAFLPSTATKKTGSTAKSAAQIAAEKAKAALEKALGALKDFQDELKTLTIQPLVMVTRELGQFEQTSVDAFDAIAKKLQEGILNKTIAKKGGEALLAYIKVERVALEALNRQRDELITKRGLAETLIADVKSAIMGVGSLAGLLETQTRQVTYAVTSIVDGFTVTTKRTVEEVVGGTGVVSKLQAVVAKTKAFASQLTDLKRLGLNPDLFKQIVDAGPDVGGQLATEILAGGADSVSALNTTFNELQTVAGTIAEQTAVVMYNAGVDVAGGLVNGLLAQEAAIVAAANQLAAAFNAAYNSQIMALTIDAPAAPSAPTVSTPSVVTPKVTTKVTNVAPKVTIKTNNVNKGTAQQIVAAVNKFYGSNSVQGRSALFS